MTNGSSTGPGIQSILIQLHSATFLQDLHQLMYSLLPKIIKGLTTIQFLQFYCTGDK